MKNKAYYIYGENILWIFARLIIGIKFISPIICTCFTALYIIMAIIKTYKTAKEIYEGDYIMTIRKI